MPSLVETIKEQGLVLVADNSDESEQAAQANSMDISPAERTYLMPTGVNGVMKANGVLRFHETIDL
jgi:CDK inhibitor PHO81